MFHVKPGHRSSESRPLRSLGLVEDHHSWERPSCGAPDGIHLRATPCAASVLWRLTTREPALPCGGGPMVFHMKPGHRLSESRPLPVSLWRREQYSCAASVLWRHPMMFHVKADRRHMRAGSCAVSVWRMRVVSHLRAARSDRCSASSTIESSTLNGLGPGTAHCS